MEVSKTCVKMCVKEKNPKTGHLEKVREETNLVQEKRVQEKENK